ncbi:MULTISPECIES: GntR family transcriptional regulator [unclassified Luteococcus]|uniref:GntR family transcriptional regulator n=1 Tax=unclassified Luteococcus TaxID=2639923 RepID=UPI00313C1210
MGDAEEPVIATKRAQVREILQRRIQEELHAGDALASERELVTQLGVSRVTVRQAIADLVEAGLLERTQGKGTYVTGPRVNSRLHLMSFSREMRARGLKPRTVVLSAAEEPADQRVAEVLEIQPGEPVVRLERLRLADGTPMAHEVGWYPSSLMPDLLQHKLNTVYDLMAEHYGLVVTRGEQSVSAEAADALHARLLGIARRAPLLVNERLTFAGDTVVEYSISKYRGDRYRIHSTLHPREQTR